jgi:hypothetical protein
MQLKPFEAGRYDEKWIVVNNPTNGMQELFSEREYAIVKFLKQNEQQSLLALLMPNIGIAKKTHIEICLSVLSKLKRIQVADYFSITGRGPGPNTKTLELVPERARLEFTSLNALAVAVQGVAARALAPIGQAGLLALVVGLAAFSFALFPFNFVERSLANSSPPYVALIFLAWFTACVGFSLRTVVQSAFLCTFDRDALGPVFTLRGPLLVLSAETSSVSLFGFKARAQMAILGLAAPFALGFHFTLLTAVHLVGPVVGFIGFGACAATTLLLACPLFSFDGADLLQALFFRSELAPRVALRLREITSTKGRMERELVFSILLCLAWVLVWLDCIHAFHAMLLSRLSADLAQESLSVQVGAIAAEAALALLVLLPLIVVGVHQVQKLRARRKKRLVVQKGKVKDSLTFEERTSALEKIPLFTYLNDQERLALLNEMEPAFFNSGDFLVHQGELGKEFFVLVKGHASAQYRDQAGKVLVLAGLDEGDAFGEIALIDDVPRTASIVSDGGCIALVLRKEGFENFAASLGSPDRVKSLVRLTSFFRRHPLFSKLSPRDQAQLIDSFRFETITSGEQVPEGDESFHVIYSGAIRVDTGGADGETTLESDDCFGYSNPLNVRFVALEGTGLLTVGKTEFHNLIWEKLVEKPELFV